MREAEPAAQPLADVGVESPGGRHKAGHLGEADGEEQQHHRGNHEGEREARAVAERDAQRDGSADDAQRRGRGDDDEDDAPHAQVSTELPVRMFRMLFRRPKRVWILESIRHE